MWVCWYRALRTLQHKEFYTKFSLRFLLSQVYDFHGKLAKLLIAPTTQYKKSGMCSPYPLFFDNLLGEEEKVGIKQL
jgi:hypothetical protein